MNHQGDPVIEARDLYVLIRGRRGSVIRAVDGVNVTLRRGEVVGIVGESGSGKTVLALTLLRLEPANSDVQGAIYFRGEDLVQKTQREMRSIRGSELSMIFQDPMTSLNPVFTVGNQLREAIRLHDPEHRHEATARGVAALQAVRIPSPAERLSQYPHEISGGMRQRVVSALAMVGEPAVLIADEPTTALDVTTQSQYLTMLRSVQARSGAALLFISHDLALVRRVVDRVIVMYAGQIVEEGAVETLFESPAHPYTRALIDCAATDSVFAPVSPIEGQPPDMADPGVACRFAPRCRFASDICAEQEPALDERAFSHMARCWGTSEGGWIKDGWHD